MSLDSRSDELNLLSQGLDLHQNGNFEGAAECYMQVLEGNPQQFDALRLRGLAARSIGHLNEALVFLERAAAVQGQSADVWNDLGLVWYDQKQFPKAVSCLNQAIRLSPDFAEAHYNLGNSYRAAKNIGLARTSYLQALRLQPHFVEAWYNLGCLDQDHHDYRQAVRSFIRAIELRGSYPEALLNLGLCYSSLGNLIKSEECFNKAAFEKRDYVAAWLHLGVTRQQLKNHEGARSAFETALNLDPNNVPVRLNLALACQELGALDPAARHAQEAIQITPSEVEPRLCLAAILTRQGKLDDAIASCHIALQLKPDSIAANRQLASLFLMKGDFGSASQHCKAVLNLEPEDRIALETLGVIESRSGSPKIAAHCFEKALRHNPDDPDLLVNLSVCELLLGQFPSGWTHFEARWRSKLTTCKPRQFSQPEWRGENPAGKTILIYWEQGFGDTIQFVRYAQDIAKLNGRVIIECPIELGRLMKTAPGITEVVHCGHPWPQIDFQIPIMSLARIFGTDLNTIPDPTPYLKVPEPSEVRLPDATSANFRVGVAWAGNPAHPNDKNRSIPIEKLGPLLEIPGLTFFSLQIGPQSGKLATMKCASPVFDLAPQLKDFSASAAAVAAMDLVVTVDTSLAHLAGALAQKTWLLLPLIPDWRWLLDRDDSPWYRTVRLFRQTRFGDWETPLQSVATELRQALRNRQSQAN